MGKQYNKTSPETRAKMLELFQGGTPIATIARELGLGVSTVRWHLVKKKDAPGNAVKVIEYPSEPPADELQGKRKYTKRAISLDDYKNLALQLMIENMRLKGMIP